MVKWIVGGVVTLVIGGTSFAVSQQDVADNFANNTGVSQDQAQQYVNNVKPSDLQSFSKIGLSYTDDATQVRKEAAGIDCTNYTYKWETPSLTCADGKSQLQDSAVHEDNLGSCYQALDTNLGDSTKDRISECITDIDLVIGDFDLPVITAVLEKSYITDSKNSNAYNKSVLQAALKPK